MGRGVRRTIAAATHQVEVQRDERSPKRRLGAAPDAPIADGDPALPYRVIERAIGVPHRHIEGMPMSRAESPHGGDAPALADG